MRDAAGGTAAPPLISIPEAPVPARAEASWYAGADGVRLRAALFRPTGDPRGSVVVNTGRIEFIEKYFEVAGELTARGFVVLVHDWRGQGLSDRLLSDRLKGHVGRIGDYVSDHRRLLDRFEDQLPGPRLVLAHSMGGALTMLALAEGEKRYAAAFLTSPMFGLNLRGAPDAALHATASGFVFTGLGGSNVELGPAVATPYGWQGVRLTHDTARMARWRAQTEACPDLEVAGFTWGWLKEALEATNRLAHDARLERIAVPVHVLAAADDDLVSVAAVRRVTERLPNARWALVEKAWHELMMEADPVRAAFWRGFDAFAAEFAPVAP